MLTIAGGILIAAFVIFVALPSLFWGSIWILSAIFGREKKPRKA